MLNEDILLRLSLQEMYIVLNTIRLGPCSYIAIAVATVLKHKTIKDFFGLL